MWRPSSTHRTSRFSRWYNRTIKVYIRQAVQLQFAVLLLVFSIIALSYSYSNATSDVKLDVDGVKVSSIFEQPSTSLESYEYYNKNLRFVLFNSWYGQFNNQLVALVNAISIARNLDAVLVLPCEKLGRESKKTSQVFLHSRRELVGDYFNYSLLKSMVHSVRPSEFLVSSDGADLVSRKILVVCKTCADFYRFLLAPPTPTAPQVKILNPNSTWPKLRNRCDFNPNHALPNLQKIYHKDRFVLLPTVFRHHDLNCTKEDPNWMTVRKYLRPKDEFLHAVDRLMSHLQQPVLAIHLRFFLNGDLGQFSPRSFVDMLKDQYGEQYERAGSIFLAYSPTSAESVQVYHLLKNEFQGPVLGGENTMQWLPPPENPENNPKDLPLSGVLLDMWTCVRSDMFIGRLGSSLSWNVMYWRQALREEMKLSWENVRPVWYTLEKFSTTGAKRAEGRAWNPNQRPR